uniref:Uncharacterized protein n=1 Tax=Romanomermis culicivorax TaxID=13658 RepID=A0A915I0Y7_ROMCU
MLAKRDISVKSTMGNKNIQTKTLTRSKIDQTLAQFKSCSRPKLPLLSDVLDVNVKKDEERGSIKTDAQKMTVSKDELTAQQVAGFWSLEANGLCEDQRVYYYRAEANYLCEEDKAERIKLHQICDYQRKRDKLAELKWEQNAGEVMNSGFESWSSVLSTKMGAVEFLCKLRLIESGTELFHEINSRTDYEDDKKPLMHDDFYHVFKLYS